jgi:hypothetical protein
MRRRVVWLAHQHFDSSYAGLTRVSSFLRKKLFFEGDGLPGQAWSSPATTIFWLFEKGR